MPDIKDEADLWVPVWMGKKEAEWLLACLENWPYSSIPCSEQDEKTQEALLTHVKRALDAPATLTKRSQSH